MAQNTINELLGDLRALIAKGTNGASCISYQLLDVTTTALQLTVPEGATSAEITVEVVVAGSTNAASAVRYTLDGTTPATGTVTASVHGVPLGDYDTIEIVGRDNLTGFKVIAADAANHKFLKIHYYR